MKKLIAGIVAIMILVCCFSAVFAETGKLGRDDAMKKALDYTGLKEEQVTFTKIKTDWDDGRQIWEIKFIHDGARYEVDIDVLTGRITEIDVDRYHGRDIDDDWDDDLDDWFDFD